MTMKLSVAVYRSHHDAIHAAQLLGEKGYSLDKVSIVGKAEIVEDQIQLRPNDPLIATSLVVGSALGTTLGLLTGIGVFAVPGLGVFFLEREP
jgi:hypothetical protein